MSEKEAQALITDFLRRSANWAAIAEEATEDYIRERSVARSQTWAQAAEEIGKVIGDLR